MKKRFLRRLLSLGICVALAAAAMTGCGNSKGEGSANKQEQEENSQDEQEQGKQEQDKQEQEESSVDKAFAPFDEPVTVKCVMGFSESTKPGVTPSTCAWNDVLKKYLNIELDWMWEVDDAQYETKLSTALASGEYPDVMRVDAITYYELLDSGALKDLTAIWEEYASKPLKDAFAALDNLPLEKVTVDGKLTAVPYASDFMTSMGVNYYRTDWLENVGMEMPTNLDELTEVIKAFRDQDPDGNGEKDTYAMAVDSSADGLMNFFYTFGSYPRSWIEKDGEIVNGAIQDETKEALDWLRGLYAEGYIDPEFATLSTEQINADVASGKAGIYAGIWFTPDQGFMKESLKSSDDVMWGVGPVVGLNEGDAGIPVAREKVNDLYNVVLESASDEAAIAMIKMLNMFYDINFHTAEGSDWTWWGTEYNEDSETWYSWWLPVNIWNPVGTYNEHLALTEAIATGKWNPDYGIQETGGWSSWASWSELLGKKYSEVDPEMVDTWLLARTSVAMARASVEGFGPCSIEILYEQKQNGNYVFDVDYGQETKTGLEVKSILKTYVTEYLCKYIMGTVSEDSWDEFVDEWLAMGGQQWTEEVNESYAKIH